MKKIISMLVGVLCLTMLFSTLAFADTKTDKASGKIQKIDSKILQMVDEAQALGDNLLSEYNSNLLANPTKTDKLTSQYNNKLDKIISNLKDRTDARVQEIMKIAEKKGIVVITEVITVKIADRNVDIDPCRTISD